MKITRSAGKNRYLTRVSIFLIVVALIVAIVGCNGETYVLTVSSTAGGSVSAPGEGIYTYNNGTVVELVATPDAGYRFGEWTGDVDTIADTNAASTNITMNNNYEITAEFVRQYNLTISSGFGGDVTTPGEGTYTYNNGTVVELVATPDAGYRFGEWTGDVDTIADANEASTNITMNNNYEITAEFVRQYNLTTSSGFGGDVTTPGEGTFTYDYGTVVDLVAVAEEGYSFADWTGDVGMIADVYAATTTITMNGDYSITANFEELDPGTLFAGGNGTEENPYQIANWHHLYNIRDYLNNHFILINDLDSTTPGYAELASLIANEGKGWQKIGRWDAPFTGSLDGQGYEIRNLFINRPGEPELGLFGAADEGGHIEDIRIVNATVTGDAEYVGGLVGYSKGTVSDSYSSGIVTGNGRVGGLVGWNQGVVSNSYSSSSVACNEPYFEGFGGLVGENRGTVSTSHSTGTVTGNRGVGGLVGNNGGTVSNCYATTSVTGEDMVGGLVGMNHGNMSNSYSTGNVNGNSSIGGLTGFNYEGVVSNSYYNYDEVLINDEGVITSGALFGEDFEEWLANDKFLDIDERLSEEGGYYIVNNVADFKELLAFGQNATLKFRLANNLDLATEPGLYIPYLAGEFDGNGHKISNLSFNFDFITQVGLFGYLAPGAEVAHLGVESADITAYMNVGGLVGENNGTVSSSYATGNVNGGYRVGGLVGENYGTVSNSYSTGSVTTNVSTVINVSVVGGLVGRNSKDGIVSNSYSTGSVTGDKYVGGLVGYNNYDATVSNSYSTGSVTGNMYVGGLVAGNADFVSNSFWDTETSGQATSSGGTGKTTAEMQNIATFSGAGWSIIAVANPSTRNPAYTWNIVDGVTYPFLSWQS
jgi:hypothetical protein